MNLKDREGEISPKGNFFRVEDSDGKGRAGEGEELSTLPLARLDT